MEIILRILIIAFLLVAILGLILLLKNENTYKQHKIILQAIYNYRIDLHSKGIHYEIRVNYDDMESYNKTFYRLWDWGYKNILPPDKFELIKPYIKKKRR